MEVSSSNSKPSCKTCPAKRALNAGDSAVFSNIFLLRVFPVPEQNPHPPPMQTVETVEKITFQKLTFEKWGRNIEERLVFCVPNNILAIFEPVAEIFVRVFKQGVFRQSR
jgi:hypothetical protein